MELCVESDKEIARKQKRKLQYFSNILVVSDPKHPENEGKVCLFRYGKKIFDKMMEAMQPAFEDETPINPFDFWEGADFKLKIRKVDGFWNYDKSEFSKPSPISDDESKIESIWKSQYSLAEKLDVNNNFKTYDELSARFHAVISGTTTVGNVSEEMDDEPVATPVVDTKPVESSITSQEEEEDTMDYFSKLANG